MKVTIRFTKQDIPSCTVASFGTAPLGPGSGVPGTGNRARMVRRHERGFLRFTKIEADDVDHLNDELRTVGFYGTYGDPPSSGTGCDFRSAKIRFVQFSGFFIFSLIFASMSVCVTNYHSVFYIHIFVGGVI